MRTLARIVTGIIGLMLAATGVQWVFAPEIAASGLYLALPEDAMARSSLIGDFSAFFVTGAPCAGSGHCVSMPFGFMPAPYFWERRRCFA